MTFELMSDGSLAELPYDSVPSGVSVPSGPFVLLLLPHNHYLLGQSQEGEAWTWGRPGSSPRKTYLYEGEGQVFEEEGRRVASISSDAALRLKRALMSLSEPPGDHRTAELALRTLLRGQSVSAEGILQPEEDFSKRLEEDENLQGAYWALRFALARGDVSLGARVKAWLRAARALPLSASGKDGSRLWLCLQDMPEADALAELESLSFSREALFRMSAQAVSPLLMYNPRSGYLALARFGKDGKPADFQAWAFLPHSLWDELRERRKLPVQEIVLALWGRNDVKRALEERRLYRKEGSI